MDISRWGDGQQARQTFPLRDARCMPVVQEIKVLNYTESIDLKDIVFNMPVLLHHSGWPALFGCGNALLRGMR
ncbi:hypothetical protein [Aquitalea magnusonii]|uniref:hypothetical protein n=1 Tax=Aquitalea magnusonii TaxID=332411 RepID=UPI0011B3C59C|nr:hypothetical protein [Aquitalea magnusonii]